MTPIKLPFMALAVVVLSAPAEAAPSAVTAKVAWYGEGYRGKRMANGQRFNPDALTCATWDYPLGARLQFTNVATGRSVVVTVTDRGPAITTRKADLSRAAFEAIASTSLGVIRCEIRRVEGSR